MHKSFLVKSEFVANVAQKTNLTTWKAEKVVDAVMSEIREALDDGKSVRFNMIGTFSPGVLEPRKYRNMHTGEIHESPMRYVPKFKISRKWRELFNRRRRDDG